MSCSGGASLVSGSSPGPELGALPVLAQIPVSEPEACQSLTQPIQHLGRGSIQAWLRCFLVLAGVSSETIPLPPTISCLGSFSVLAQNTVPAAMF